jgi:hypothetical protein
MNRKRRTAKSEIGQKVRQGAKRAKFVQIFLHFRPWRPFGFAQDGLGAINFPGVVLFKISKARIYFKYQ